MAFRLLSALRWTPVGVVVHDHFFGITSTPLHAESHLLSDHPYHITSDDQLILYRRTNTFTNQSLVIFNSPSHLSSGSAMAVGKVEATPGDLIYEDGHFQIVQSGQISLSHQAARLQTKLSDLSSLSLPSSTPTSTERLEESSNVVPGGQEGVFNEVVDTPSPTSDFGGLVPFSMVEGEALAVIWPPSKIRRLLK